MIGCGLCIALLVIGGPIAVSGWLLSVGLSHKTASCDGPLSMWAIVQGSLGITTAFMGLLVLIAIVLLATSEEEDVLLPKEKRPFNLPSTFNNLPFFSLAGEHSWKRAFAYISLLLSANTAGLLSLASFGVFIWGTVLAFRNDHWETMKTLTAQSPAPPASQLPCDPSLYFPSAIFIIVVWSIIPVVLLVALILVCIPLCMTWRNVGSNDSFRSGDEGGFGAKNDGKGVEVSSPPSSSSSGVGNGGDAPSSASGDALLSRADEEEGEAGESAGLTGDSVRNRK